MQPTIESIRPNPDDEDQIIIRLAGVNANIYIELIDAVVEDTPSYGIGVGAKADGSVSHRSTWTYTAKEEAK